MSTHPDREVVITGCGWVTPFAAGLIEDVLSAAASRAGADPPPVWLLSEKAAPGRGEMPRELLQEKAAWLAALAFRHACQQAALGPDDREPARSGLVLGSSLAGIFGMTRFATEVREQSSRFVSPIHFPQTVGNYVAGALARAFELQGPNSTIASGVGSGLLAMSEAAHQILAGQADVVIAGGSDSIPPEYADRLASEAGCVSEGACLFVLEEKDHARARGAAPLAMIRDPGGSADPVNDAHPIYSTAGRARAEAVWIQSWIGMCHGALGAAAAAAGLGAAAGAEVPIAMDSAGASVRARELPAVGKYPTRVVAVATGDEGENYELQLELPGT